jgi:hypothetical protein
MILENSLAISNNVIVVGSPSDEINQKQKHGSAYIFAKNEGDSGFDKIQKIYHGNGNEYDQFGFSLSKYKNRIAIGIPLKEVFSSLSGNVTFNQGAVHIYEQDQKTDNWDLSQVVTANDGGTGDKFGTSTAIYDYVLIASTDSEDPAYVFHRYDEIYCYGKRAIDEGACGGSSNGTCVAQDQCECNMYHTGFECQYLICLNLTLFDRNNCGAENGTCIGPDHCLCDDAHTGPQCQYSKTCFDIVATNPDVCNGNGTCVEIDTCQCDRYYTGEQCQYPICYGVSTSNRSSCGGENGTCIASNVCSCSEDYGGSQCQLYYCGEYKFTDANVCGGNGYCVAPDTCVCQDGYQGAQYQIKNCDSDTAIESAEQSNAKSQLSSGAILEMALGIVLPALFIVIV